MATKPSDSTKLITFDFGPLTRSLDNLRVGMTNIEKKVINLEALRVKDTQDLDKYKTGQKAVQDVISRNVQDVDEKVQLSQTAIKKHEHQIFSLNIEKDIQQDFTKTQQSQNSDFKMDILKMQQRITESDQAALNNLAIKFKEIDRQIKASEALLRKQIEPLMLFPDMVTKMKEDLEKQDLYVFEIAERTEKIEIETRDIKMDLNSGIGSRPLDISPQTSFADNQPHQVAGTFQLTQDGVSQAQAPQMMVQAPQSQLDLKYFVKKSIQEHNPGTRADLSRQVVEMIKETKRQQQEDEAELEAALHKPQQTPPATGDNEAKKEADDTNKEEEPAAVKPKPIVQFDWNHLPSQIDQVLEDHVRQGGNTLVYLEQMRPRFRQFEVASEIHQIFNHVEVQTFQQDQILKQSNKNDLSILEVNLKLEEMVKTIKKATMRLDSLDEGRTQDIAAIEALPEKTDQHRSLLSIFADMKSDVLARCGGKDQFRDLEARLANMERENQRTEGDKNHALKQDLDRANESIATYNKTMQALQLQIMKTDTNVFDLQRSVTGFDEKIQEFQQLEAVIGSRNQFITAGNFQEPNETLEFGIKIMAQLNLVSQSQYSELKKELDAFVTQVHSHDNKIEYVNGKMADHTKLIRQIDKKAEKAEKEANEMKIFAEKTLKDLKGKIDTTDFDDEIRHLTSQISALDFQGKANQMRGQNMRPLPKKAPPQAGSGGMTKEDKKKLDDTVEGLDKLEQSLRVLSTLIRNINLDEIKGKLKEIPDKVSKQNLDQSNMQFTLEINKMKNQIGNSESAQGSKMDRLGDRVTRVFEANVEKSEEIKILSEQMNRIEDSIQAIKRRAQQDQMKKKLSIKQPDPSPIETPTPQDSVPQQPVAGNQDNEDQNEIDEKFTRMHALVISKIEDHNDKIRRLQVQAGQGKDQKKSPEIKRLEDQINHLTSSQIQEVNRLHSQIDDLRQRFEEKIRRQNLVQQKKLSPTNSDEELLKGMKNRPKFMAQHMTRELVLNGRLPQLEQYGDHLARYGKGFSQMLNIAGDQRPPETQTAFSPRLMEGFNISEMVINQEELKRHVNSNGEIIEVQERGASLENGSQSHRATAKQRSGTIQSHATIDNPFAMNTQAIVSPAHSRKVSQRRNTTNRSHLDTSHKKVKIDEHHSLVFSPLTRSGSILVLPTIN